MSKQKPKTLWELTDLFAAGEINDPKELAGAVKIYSKSPQKSFKELLELATHSDVKNRIFSSLLLEVLRQNKKTAINLKKKLEKLLADPGCDEMTKAAVLAMLSDSGSSWFADYYSSLSEPLRKFSLQHLTEMFTDELLTDEVWPAFLVQPLDKQRFVLQQLRESKEPLLGSFLNWVITQNKGPLRKEARAALRYMQARGVNIEERLTGPDPALHLGKAWRTACAMRHESICALTFSWQKPSGNFSLLTFTINYCSALNSAGIIDIQFSSEVRRRDIESFFAAELPRTKKLPGNGGLTGSDENGELTGNDKPPGNGGLTGSDDRFDDSWLVDNDDQFDDSWLVDNDDRFDDSWFAGGEVQPNNDSLLASPEDEDLTGDEASQELSFITLEYHQALWLLQEAAELGIHVNDDSLWYKFKWLLNEPVHLNEQEKEDVIYRLLEEVAGDPVALADTYFQALLWNDKHLKYYLLSPLFRKKIPVPPKVPVDWNLKDVAYQLLLQLKENKNEIILAHAITNENKEQTVSIAGRYVLSKRNKSQLYIKSIELEFLGEIKENGLTAMLPRTGDINGNIDIDGNIGNTDWNAGDIDGNDGEKFGNEAGPKIYCSYNQKNTEITRVVNRFWMEEIEKTSDNTQRKYSEALGIVICYCNWAGLEGVEELDEEALEEFLSWWYIRKYLNNTPFKARQLLSALKRFFKWCSKNGHPAAQKRYLKVYRKLKDDLPRCLEACSIIKSSENFLLREPSTRADGWFELVQKDKKGWHVQDVLNGKEYYPLRFSTLAEKHLRQGDIINLLLARYDNDWVIEETGFVYPPLARFYIQ